jgi:eukaryotic-like serine/threonine-protein kinase
MADSERIGPYRVIRKLGAGGMGEVVLAHDDRLDRLVAIKRLHDDHAATPDRRERFRREARIVARLNHPAIVQIHDVLHQDDHDYLIMEYIEGRTLRERCDAGPMSVAEVLGIVHQIALGMAAAHDLGVIHRDLKAENILITPADRAKITDFGIAKLHGDDTLTADGAIVGTFRAMSPEQALGRAIDHRSDLFSFGILLYEALAGISPFRAETSFVTVQRLVSDDPRPITELVPSIPGDLASLLHQLLAKEPLLRPRDFHEVADALLELAGQACDAPCHAASSSGGGLPSRGEDTHSAGGSPAPVRSLLATGPAAAGGSGAPAIPSSGVISRLDQTVETAVEPLTRAAGSGRSAPLDTSDHAAVPARPRGAPRRLPWYVAAVGLTVLGALGIGYAVRGGHSGASLIRVAVLPPDFSDAADRPNVALLASRVRDAVMADMRARDGIDLVAWGDIDSYVEGLRQHPGSPPGQRTIRAAVGADEVIATHIECSVPSSCRIRIERDANSASSPPPEPFDLAADSAGSPGSTVTFHLSRLYPDHPGRAAAAAGSIDPRDYGRYSRLVHDYWAGRAALSTSQLLVELEDIRERSPSSLDVLLFEAEVLRHHYLQTNDSGQAWHAMALLQAADKLFPATYSILSARFDILLAAHHEGDADVVLDQLAILDPDSSVTHLQRAKLHFQRGERERARDELDEAAQRDSFSWRVLYYRAKVSKALGDRAATRAAIDQLIERSPGNYGGLSLLALEERDASRLACAEQIFARLVARTPLFDECLNLGYTRDQLGRYRAAADSFHCALAIRPDDASARLGLAESLLLDGNTYDAGTHLRALRDLLDRRRHDAPDGALKGKDLLVEAQTLAYLGRDDPAMATAARVRAAVLMPAARPIALYTAALVHAFLGDRDLAAKYVKAYLDSGSSPADFAYPWFDDLRRDPVLGPRLVVVPFAPTCEAGSAP